jgi:HAD superfamily hydrolase (TIGR01509 family)
MRPAGIIFDFDGVLIDSEYVGNVHLAETLTALGYPTRLEDALQKFSGLSGRQFIDAVEAWIGATLPRDFYQLRMAEDERVVREGVEAIAGAVDFVRHLPPDLPRAVASSSSTEWIRAHLDHLGLTDAFEPHIYSGREHVARGKPAPDLYLLAAERLGVPIADCVIIEDSEVGAKGAVASGARVIGLAAGSHCLPGHGDVLRALGVREVAEDFEQVARLLSL